MASAAGASVVIIGGGVTGLSAGWWLARAGVEVLVLERDIVGWQASGRNGGGCTHIYSPFGLEEQKLWPQMDELLGYPTEHQPNRIRVALNEHQLTLFRRSAEIAAQRGFRTDFLSPKELKELVPVVGDNTLGGTFTHYGGHANPQRTVQAYAWALEDLGGRILQDTTVTGITRADGAHGGGGRVTGVTTTRGPFAADALVIAAGPQTALLASMVGVPVPLAPARVEMIVTEPMPLMRYGGVDGNGLYGRQARRGNLIYGGGPHEWIDLDGLAAPELPTSPLTRNLARRLAELFPGAAHLRLIRSWAGVVENTPDGLPIVDRLASPDNVVLGTMSSVGFGLSPAVGKAISELVIHGACRFADLSSVRLGRFAATPPDWRTRQGWLPAAARAPADHASPAARP